MYSLDSFGLEVLSNSRLVYILGIFPLTMRVMRVHPIVDVKRQLGCASVYVDDCEVDSGLFPYNIRVVTSLVDG